MGVAELVPGVSGGTIALITGIYERLLAAIGGINLTWLRLIISFIQGKASIRQVLEHIDAGFLIVLALGMGTSFLIFVELMSYLLHEHTVLLWAFFLGLLAGTAYMLSIQAGRVAKGDTVIILIGVVIGLSISRLSVDITPNPWMIVAAGGIASCAWILPAISGSFILLALGLYQDVIEALVARDFAFLALFSTGVILGLPAFSRTLSRLLEQRRPQVSWFLIAFILSSLHQLWPWQQTSSYYDVSGGQLIGQPVLPSTYLELTGESPMLFGVLVLVSLGVAIVVILERKRTCTA